MISVYVFIHKTDCMITFCDNVIPHNRLFEKKTEPIRAVSWGKQAPPQNTIPPLYVEECDLSQHAPQRTLLRN